MTEAELTYEFSKGVLNWYPFNHNGKALWISGEADGIFDLLSAEIREVQKADGKTSTEADFVDQTRGQFDYIVAIGTVECLNQPAQAFQCWREMLKPDGKLLLGMENRLGLRYFCGDWDPFTNRSLDGVENYKRVSPLDWPSLGGRCYSRDEIKQMLGQAGWENYKFYSVLPALSEPQVIYAEDYLPREDLSIRLFPVYHHPESLFLEEEFIYKDLAKNGMFHAMANAYLIECTKAPAFAPVNQVTLTMDRGREHAQATVIRSDKTVEKLILYSEGRKKLQQIQENVKDLKDHGIHVIEGHVTENAYTMPYMDRESLVIHWSRLAKENLPQFKQEMDEFYHQILQSSEHVGEEGEGVGIILKKGYWDLAPLNCFYDNGKFLFYDQEFYLENHPAKSMIFRAIILLYWASPELEQICPRQYFLDKYELNERLDLWWKDYFEVTKDLRHQGELKYYRERVQRDNDLVNQNRQRMNYAAAEYKRTFIDLFRNVRGKKLILFGSGNFAKEFLRRYGDEYPVDWIVDSNQEKWGQTVSDIPIRQPETLLTISPGERRIIICIKGYMGAVSKLRKMGIQDYCIYDPGVDLPWQPQEEKGDKATLQADEGGRLGVGNEKNGNDVFKGETEEGERAQGKVKASQKKYHVGYVAGVFDLFHIGHLRLLEKAKEQCDYLIAGVMDDRWVQEHKHSEPFIPFEEREAIVKACRYVDEVVRVSYQYNGIREMYKKLHFDCQFSGNDHAENQQWLEEKEFLEKEGAEMVFFPYTEGTSSTTLKALIRKALV